MTLQRLQKILSAAGVCSRRKAEELITDGLVKVNGHVAELGQKADPETDVIKVRGKVLRATGERRYLLLNKPKRFVTTKDDPEGRRTVMDLVGKGFKGIYPVGRLDFETEGLLLMTSDGEFANAIMHPKGEVPKTYHAKLKGVLTDRQLDKLRKGVPLDDGMTAPAIVKKQKLTETNSWIEITIHEGRYRQVRRMFDKLGHTVLKLRRVRLGPLNLKGVPIGKFRELTPGEVEKMLKMAAGTSRSGEGGKTSTRDSKKPGGLSSQREPKGKGAAGEKKTPRRRAGR